jgi:hypothetical protein
MKHLADEFDPRWLVGILFFEVHHKPKGAILKGCVAGSDDDSIPTKSARSASVSRGDSVTASYHVMTLSAIGLALTPAGGSVCMRLKSRIKRLRAAVDMVVELRTPRCQVVCAGQVRERCLTGRSGTWRIVWEFVRVVKVSVVRYVVVMNVRQVLRRWSPLHFDGQAKDKRAGCCNEQGHLTRDVFPDCHLRRL